MVELIDLVIVGAGPAALTAALYAARAGLKVVAYERANIGGELAQIAEISNYPGFTGAGAELAAAMRGQAQAAGAQLAYGECQGVAQRAGEFELTVDGEAVRARSVLIATGATPKTLSFAPAAPVSYCALCDGEFAKGKHIAVIGGANAAVQESLYLAPLVSSLTLIAHSQLKADRYLQNKLKACQNVKIIENTEPTAEMLAEFERVFVFIGRMPATEFLADTGVLGAGGYVVTDGASRHQTVVPGLFAAGDVRSGMPKQVVTAAGDGAEATIEIIEFLRDK